MGSNWGFLARTGTYWHEEEEEEKKKIETEENDEKKIFRHAEYESARRD